MTALLAAVALSIAALLAPAASAAPASPGAISADPSAYDGQTVTLTGTITNFRARVSRQGNAYFTFDLSDGKSAIRIFSFGQASCQAGTVTVEGRFEKVKQSGRYTFYSEVQASTIVCR